jgi:hypothetical protein
MLQIYWSHNGVQLEEDDLHTVEIIEDVSVYTTTLTLENVTPQEAGTYKCVAINEVGEETVSASLIVKGKLGIQQGETIPLLHCWCNPITNCHFLWDMVINVK